jgi:5,10-methylenetetrahydromethanopterin reductase
MTDRPFVATLIGNIRPEEVGGLARRYEADGWDGVWCVDSQNIAGDAYVNLATVAAVTDRVRFGPWVTNPATRHPAVTACAIATLDALSGGRADLAIGRGDSALANLGAAPAAVSDFAGYLTAVRDYLAGRPVELTASRAWMARSRPVSEIPLGHVPAASRLVWRRPGERVVPVEVAASGPRMIAVGSTSADRVTLAVGADVDRLRWALDLAHSARKEAGLDPEGISYGAAMSVIPLDDMDKARRLCAGAVASQARFSVMHGRPLGPGSHRDEEVLTALASSYDMEHHGRAGSQVNALTDDFIDRFAVLGPPSRCVDRIREIAGMGIDHLTFYLGGAQDGETAQRVYRAIVDDVLPNL